MMCFVCQDLCGYGNKEGSLLSRSGLAMKNSCLFVIQIATLGLNWEKAIDYPPIRKLLS